MHYKIQKKTRIFEFDSASVCTAPSLPEAVWLKLRGDGEPVQRRVVLLFGFGRRDAADLLEPPPIVEPINPFEGREFNRFEATPWAPSMNDVGLVGIAYR